MKARFSSWMERHGRAVANASTSFRMAAIPFAVWLIEADQRVAAVVLMALMLLSDALDGWAARKAGKPPPYGERLDVLADRAVEWTFWIYFGIEGSLPFWVAGVVIVRTLGTDLLLRFRLSGWRRKLRDPVWSRGSYGLIKTASASFLALEMVSAGRAFAYIAVAVCLLRAAPTVAGLAVRLEK